LQEGRGQPVLWEDADNLSLDWQGKSILKVRALYSEEAVLDKRGI